MDPGPCWFDLKEVASFLLNRKWAPSIVLLSFIMSKLKQNVRHRLSLAVTNALNPNIHNGLLTIKPQPSSGGETEVVCTMNKSKPPRLRKVVLNG